MINTHPKRFGSGALTAAVSAIGLLLLCACDVPETPARAAETASDCLTRGDAPNCRFVDGPVSVAPVAELTREGRVFYPTRGGLGFVDSGGRRWVAPQKTLTDGASIPPAFISLIGHPRSDIFREAATVHDAYCGIGNEDGPMFHAAPWEDVHRMFYDALIVNGTPPLKAKLMFAAVYLGGPRWNDPERDLGQVDDAALQQEMKWCMRWIRQKNPSRERIIEWMRGREAALKSGGQSAPNWDVLLAE